MPGNSILPVLQPDGEGLDRAAALLTAGGLVAVPTETVYGLAARADRDEAVAAIYRAKGRPSFNPLIVHVQDLEQAERLAWVDDRARLLASEFWPGPLTMILSRRDDAGLAAAVTAGLPSIALRCPAHEIMQALLGRVAFPLAAPSANRSGQVSPTTAGHVVQSLGGRIDAVIDGGACRMGLESTIVALRSDQKWSLLRPGPVSAEQLCGVLGEGARADAGAGKIEAPGQLESHYAPGKPMRLGVMAAAEDEFHIGFGEVEGDYNLSVGGDLFEAAARLYAALYVAAESDWARIAVAPIPETGIGLAIADRLRRAAA